MTTAKARINTARNGNGTAKAANTKATVSTPPTAKATVEDQAIALLKELRNAVFKEFGVKLQVRNQRIATKVGHASREKIGLDIAAQVKKKNGKKLDWNRWNNKVFVRLFGAPDSLKHPTEVVALALAMLYDTIDLTPEQAIADLVEFNRQSLEKRNSFNNKEEDEDDADLEDLEDLDEEEEEEDEDSEEEFDDEDEDEDEDEEDEEGDSLE
ncbi:primosomal protein [Iningainema tapete]|uniref:Primosomal protein n=1 Tax=Iningainema tapete BLCC-T55 TaxID=2748662 RepID=A0A8J7BWW6_9CYAN|nr:primosomal protein [Iningainema tapete]MBD2772592.1 primosomal protein [Iningainema tapete BLCC-T55]